MGQNIDLKQLSPEQRKQLMAEAAELQRKEKEQRKANRKTFKKLAEEFVNENINNLVFHQNATAEIIQRLFDDHKSILELKAMVYGNKVEEQDSHTCTLADGSASITIGWNVSIGFDGTEAEGVKKIKNYTASLVDDSEKVKKLTKMVNTFLKPNAKTGTLNPSRIIELSNLREEFNSQEFNDGLDIIFNAQQRRRNSMYVSGWKFVDDGEKPPYKVEFRFTM